MVPFALGSTRTCLLVIIAIVGVQLSSFARAAHRTIEATVDETGEIVFSNRNSPTAPIGIIDPRGRQTFGVETFIIKVDRDTDIERLSDVLLQHGMVLRRRLNRKSIEGRDDSYLVEFTETSSLLTKNFVAAQLNGLSPTHALLIEAKPLVEQNCGRTINADDRESADRILEKLQNYNTEKGHKTFYEWSQTLYRAIITPTIKTGNMATTKNALMRRVQSQRVCNVTWENILWIPTRVELEEYMNEAKKMPQVIHADKNTIFQLDLVPNDPLLSPHLGVIKAYQAWDISLGSASVIVGVIDSGAFFGHVDLQGQFYTNPDEIASNGIDDDLNGYIDDTRGWDFVNNDNDPDDDLSNHHGTHVAGTIGALINNGAGVVGVSPHVRLMILKTFDSTGSGSDSDIIEALYYAIDNGAKLTSNSYGGGA